MCFGFWFKLMEGIFLSLNFISLLPLNNLGSSYNFLLLSLGLCREEQNSFHFSHFLPPPPAHWNRFVNVLCLYAQPSANCLMSCFFLAKLEMDQSIMPILNAREGIGRSCLTQSSSGGSISLPHQRGHGQAIKMRRDQCLGPVFPCSTWEIWFPSFGCFHSIRNVCFTDRNSVIILI